MQCTKALKKHKDSMDRKAYLTALTEDFVQFSYNLQEVHDELLNIGGTYPSENKEMTVFQ